MIRIAVIVPALDETSRLDVLLDDLVRRCDIDQILVVDASRSTSSMDFYAGPQSSMAELVSERVRLIGCPRIGRSLQMNLGGDLADADVLLFLHADSQLPADDLRNVLGAAIPRPGWGRFDVRLDRDAWWAVMIARAMNLRSWLTGIATGDQGLFISRTLWRKSGGYRDMPLMEDIELCSRLRKIARPFRVRATLTTAARRWERHGVWRTIFLMWRLRWLYWRGADPRRLAGLYREAR